MNFGPLSQKTKAMSPRRVRGWRLLDWRDKKRRNDSAFFCHVSLADSSGLILAARVGKHTDELIEALVVSSEGKTTCKQWNSDDWGGYERVLPPEILHYIGKDKTQRLERTNGMTTNATLASQTE